MNGEWPIGTEEVWYADDDPTALAPSRAFADHDASNGSPVFIALSRTAWPGRRARSPGPGDTAATRPGSTGRRPEEIATLAWDCLARDEDGAPVLVYDNRKAGRDKRRLPISETTASVILAQQQRVRARFPHAPIGELKLLPADRRNPRGAKALTAFSLSFAHRAWVARLPALTTSDGTEFDKRRVILYAYRHTYAQRHADAGVPIDVELMDHRSLDTTRGYYSNSRELHQAGEFAQVAC